MAPPDLWNHPVASSSSHTMLMVIVRQLLSRLVFALRIDHSLSMEIVAFWLWIQGNGHLDFLGRINSFSDSRLCEIAAAGNRFIEALYDRCKSPAAVADPFFTGSSSSGGRSAPQPQAVSYFQKQAVAGITFYLNNVCLKAFEDVIEMEKMKQEQANNMYWAGQQGRHQHGSRRGRQAVDMSTRDLLSKIRASYINNAQGSEDGTSSGGASVMSPGGHILHDVNCTTDIVHQPRYDLTTLMENLNIRDRPYHAIQSQQCSSVPADERTLFVTFSNGYPFTKAELYEFFMRKCGDVEEVTVEEPVESRPPLYAHSHFSHRGPYSRS